jgi:hypothetical protein
VLIGCDTSLIYEMGPRAESHVILEVLCELRIIGYFGLTRSDSGVLNQRDAVGLLVQTKTRGGDEHGQSALSNAYYTIDTSRILKATVKRHSAILPPILYVHIVVIRQKENVQ